jgi:hypothetical protein
MGHAQFRPQPEANDAERSGEGRKPASPAVSAFYTPVHDVGMADRPANAQALADQVYGLILRRIKTELRMRGR